MSDLAQLSLLNVDAFLGSTPLPGARGPVRLDLSPKPERDRAALMRACLERLGYRYDMERIGDAPFEANLALNLLPGLMVMEGRMYGTRNSRTRAMVEDGTDDAVLLINLRGDHCVEQFGKEVVLGDGDAILVSGSDPSAFTHKPPGNVLGLRFPKLKLASKLADRDGAYMCKIPGGSARLGLLRRYLGLTWGAEVTADPCLAELMSTQIMDLLALTLGATADTEVQGQAGGLRASRFLMLRQEIERRLSDPALSLFQLAVQFRCTPRSLQRLFEDEGMTFTEYVLQKRLELARSKLADARAFHEKISTIAADCGFSDLSYFNRAFRRQFGITPSAVRAGLR